MRDFSKDTELMKSYGEYDEGLRRKRLKIILMLGSFFVMIFGILDFIVYPDLALKMILARGITVVVLLLWLLVLMRGWFGDIKLLGFLSPFTVFALIDVLVFLSEGISSPYYSGLILTTVALSTFYVWTFYEMLFACMVMLFSYLATAAIYISIYEVDSYEYSVFANNVFFVISVGFFCIVSAYLNSKLRFKEFCLNYELGKNLIVSKDELKSSLEDVRDFQQKLVQSEKLNSMGSLSASVIHEVNNPLNYTLLALRFLRDNSLVENNEDLKDIVNDIETGMGRINDIVKEFRDFVRLDGGDKKSKFFVSDAVKSALKFTVYGYNDIEIRNNIDSGLEVVGSKNHIAQVLINLISNSCRAIEKSGKSKGLIEFSSEVFENRVRIFVRDNGVGMSGEELEKVFDMFYTTSEVGKGTGLGLSICSTIIQSHGGELKVESEVGKGTVFSFDLVVG